MAMNLYYIVFMSIMLILISSAMADDAKDREECMDQLVNLATCLPYVSGEAKSPTPDCCTGLKQVLKNDKKCLCVIIRDRNDPQLGLQINVTLALGLPSTCSAPANVSQCPALLKLDPNSPEAQVFYPSTKSSNLSPMGPAAAPSPTAGADPTSASSKRATSDGICRGKRWLGLEIVSGGFLMLHFLSSYVFI